MKAPRRGFVVMTSILTFPDAPGQSAPAGTADDADKLVEYLWESVRNCQELRQMLSDRLSRGGAQT